jgi:hypothetical protein
VRVTITRTEAVRGVRERIGATLHAYGEMQLIDIPAQFLRVPEPGREPEHDAPSGNAFRDFFGLGAGHPARVLRGGRLPDLGGLADEVQDAVRELWEHAGCTVDDVAGLDGRLLIVHDPAGYLISLSRHADDDPILTVASPPLAPERLDRGFAAGLLSGTALGCLGPCAGSVVPSAAVPALAGMGILHWAWVPLFLLVTAGSLWQRETRRFGAGLLISGALFGITVAGIVSV